MNTKIYTFASWKGGTGKTSLSCAAIETLAKQGSGILIIDLDSNLSMSSIYNAIGANYTSIDLLNGNIICPNITSIRMSDRDIKAFIIPSDLRIARLNNISDRVLKTYLSKIKNIDVYDYIFIDPPGTMNALTRNAMVAADKIIIPAMISDIDYQATGLIMEELEMIGVDADVKIVLNRFDAKRTPVDAENRFRHDEKLQPFLWPGKIPSMKSICRLTAELLTGYSLQGAAKTIIDNFVEEVIK
ncbi:MAG: ParA family protein [Candidatus Omnitrophica bacterium]|nr:ParA family protein [Candidatus Omnitrophota bacterium]